MASIVNEGAPNTPMESADRKAPCRPAGNKPSSQSTEFQLRKYLLLLSTLVATVTYAAGLNLPGGAWQENSEDGHVHHLAGDLILHYAHRRRFFAFYYCNATAFAASLVVSLLLLVLDGTNTGWEALLRVVMVLDLLGLMGAYAAGSCRDTFTTIYSALLVCGVFAYIAIAFSAYVISKRSALAMVLSKKQGMNTEKHHAEDTENQGEDTDIMHEDEAEELREVLMLLATFAVTITYVAGLSPPGGFWDDTKDGHKMSDPVLQEHNPRRYQAFYVCNTTAFVASLLIIILLVDKKLSSNNKSVRFVALYGLIVTALLGLMGAYAAGSCREVDDTTYVVSLIGAVLAYIFLQVALTKWLKVKRFFFASSQHQTAQDQIISSGITRNTHNDEAMEKARSLVMLLATLAVSITYQAGLDPPGGLWPDDGQAANGRYYKNGDPILLTTHPTRYKVFFYSNSAAFVASLIVIIMVQSTFLLKRHHILQVAMMLDLFGLISAYAAGSCRDEITSIYVVTLAGIVFVYVVIHIIFFTLDPEENNPQDAEKLENRREVLLLLAILVATLTYQAGLTPPGGFWSDEKDGHHAGYPILHDNYNPRYSAFFYCNAASFMSSVALIVLLVNPNLYRPGIRCYALSVCMVVGMFGLMGAYAAGSARDLRTSIYVITLVAAVFAFVALEVIIFWVYPYLKNRSSGNGSNRPPQGKSTGKTPQAEKDNNMQEYLMLLGVLAASVTYQSGLKPPGGLWQDSNGRHSSGNPILHDINKGRYYAFFYSNSTSFMASIVVVILLLPWTLHKHQLPLWPMQTAVLLDMFGLLVAYAAGGTRDWETSKNVIYLIIPVLVYVAAALIYVAAHRTVSIIIGMKRQSHNSG